MGMDFLYRSDGLPRRFAPRNDGPSFSPRNDGPSFSPRNDGPSFSPRNDGPSYAPRNAAEACTMTGRRLRSSK